MPETYAPIILKQRATALRKETGDPNIVSPRDLDEQSLTKTLAVNLSRPFQMLAREPIVIFSCLYLALAFSIFYLYFQAYPIIFEGRYASTNLNTRLTTPRGIYGMSPGNNGLCFLPSEFFHLAY